jgi:hypothetical protein
MVRLVRFVNVPRCSASPSQPSPNCWTSPTADPNPVPPPRALSTSKIADLNHRIADLIAMRDALDQLVVTCDKPRAQRYCPILREIAREPELQHKVVVSN